jgi:hypothetical protein
MARLAVTWAGIAAAISLSALYVASTFLYLSPPNPLALQLWPAIQRIQEPFFVQNWHLFAPRPIRTNLVLAVRCRFGDRVTPWHEPFTPMLALYHQHRITPLGKVIRLPANAMHLALGWSSDEWRPLICRRTPADPVCRGQDPAGRRQRELGEFVLHRLASAACDDLAGSGRATAFQERILIHEPPPWSGRDLPADAGFTRYIEFPWHRDDPPESGRGGRPRWP